LGGEGRNFQHAEAVVHIDLPWSPSRVEQRIGRLDRIGRALERDVLSVVYCGPSELESAIFRMHRETFCVFDKSIGPVEFRLTALRNDLCSALVLGPAAVMALQPAILEAVTAAKAEDEELMDAALQLSQDEFEEGKELVDSLRRAPWQDWQQAATGWARELGIICEPQVNGTIRVQVKPDQMQVDVTGVSSLLKSGIYGTFSRKEALADESIHFFGPGHPLLDTLELLLDNSWLGRACIWKRNLGPANGRVYALFHLIYEPDFSLLGEQTGRAMVELAILRHYQQGTSHIAVALPNSEHPEYEVVGHELVRRMLDKASSLGALTVAELPQLGAPDFAYRLMLKVEQAQKETIKAFREQRRQVILETAKRFAHDVQSTIDALRNRIEEDDSAVAAREELGAWLAAPEAIVSERARVDGVQLVFTPKKQSAEVKA
jgi:ATP-dependent helicase HepA